jgi:coenzyme F420 hydrogenase subunit beta
MTPKQIEYETVSDVAKEGLCCFCGACQAICPHDAIQLDISGNHPVPVVHDAKCTRCGLCVKVCPGHEIDFDTIIKRDFPSVPTNTFVGPYQSFSYGGVCEKKKRFNRTSGGLAKEIAIYGLEKYLWKGVAISCFNHDMNNTYSEIVTTVQAVENAASSLYYPVTLCTIIKDILEFDGKVCVVGLPCHD